MESLDATKKIPSDIITLLLLNEAEQDGLYQDGYLVIINSTAVRSPGNETTKFSSDFVQLSVSQHSAVTYRTCNSVFSCMHASQRWDYLVINLLKPSGFFLSTTGLTFKNSTRCSFLR
jgi:hypothetical protein